MCVSRSARGRQLPSAASRRGALLAGPGSTSTSSTAKQQMTRSCPSRPTSIPRTPAARSCAAASPIAPHRRPAAHAGASCGLNGTPGTFRCVQRWYRQLRVRVALLLAGCSLLVLLILFALVVPPLRSSLQNSREDRLANAVHGALPELAADIGLDSNKAVDKAELLTSAHTQVWEDFGSTTATTGPLPFADSHGPATTEAPEMVRQAFLQQTPKS